MNKLKHIGLVLPSVPGYSETFFLNKIKGLLKNGFKVSLFVENRKSNGIPEYIRVYYQPEINKKFYLFISIIKTFTLHPIRCCKFLFLERTSFRSWINAIKNLIINSHIIGKSLDWLHFGFSTNGIRRENLALAMGAKSAVSFRGFDIGLFPYQHPGCYNLLWQKLDKIHTISDSLYKQAINLGLDPKIPYQKITPAIDKELFKSTCDKDLHNPLRVLTVGRLKWIKGYEYALKALSTLINNNINIEYHIVGQGDYKEPIIYAIHQLNLTECVQLKGWLSHKEIKREMDWADIYIQPSIQEGFCNAVLEAQAMGLLCIVTNAEGLSENVLDGKTGWVVPKRSPEKIYNKFMDILSLESEKLNQIREYSVSRVRNEFNLDTQNKLFSNFYD